MRVSASLTLMKGRSWTILHKLKNADLVRVNMGLKKRVKQITKNVDDTRWCDERASDIAGKVSGNFVSEGVPIIMSSVLSILSFRKLELSYAFISCMQTEIWSIWVDRQDPQDVYI